jgi:membrane-anchored mycosin MYCP
MADNAATSGKRKPVSKPDEILVALSHLEQVETVLREANKDRNGALVEHPVRWEVVDRSEALGLARVRLADVRSAATTLAAFVTPHLDGHAVKAVPGVPAEGQEDDVTRVLVGLRSYFASQYAGWMPILGKNRLLGHISGAGQGTEGGVISHGGGGAPSAVRAQLPARGDGPGQGVRVGLLDTRIAPEPWLAGGWTGLYKDVLPPAYVYPQTSGHATFAAGLILGQAPAATLRVRQVLSEDGTADAWAVANDIVALGRSGIDVLNLSFVCYTADSQPPLALSTAIDRLDPDIVVVAAAGNHGDVDQRVQGCTEDDARTPAWPAALDDVVAVGASTRDGGVASFTPKDARWIDLLAPGVNVVSTYLTGRVQLDDGLNPTLFSGVAAWSGTSFAAALISGAIAARTSPGRVSAREAIGEIRGLAARTAQSAPPNVKLDVMYAPEST